MAGEGAEPEREEGAAEEKRGRVGAWLKGRDGAGFRRTGI